MMVITRQDGPLLSASRNGYHWYCNQVNKTTTKNTRIKQDQELHRKKTKREKKEKRKKEKREKKKEKRKKEKSEKKEKKEKEKKKRKNPPNWKKKPKSAHEHMLI
ncbi:hypothetical protein llap_8193 [Limosa lapponica baueri]|uniref:Uncharacterized protein n=1 Tax=Limosa lapponica baueri TaxID=1758121 RepID=A0A2I0U650_LIMLA|nr:hypothetical protein llap_8193 [Limosa lapponica baueri]